MEFIITLITAIVLTATLLAYTITKGQPTMQDFMDDEEEEKETINCESTPTKITTPSNFSPELRALIEESDELSKQLDELLQDPAVIEELHNYHKDGANFVSEDDVEVKTPKKKYLPKAPKTQK
jgi:hypothetical protein